MEKSEEQASIESAWAHLHDTADDTECVHCGGGYAHERCTNDKMCAACVKREDSTLTQLEELEDRRAQV